MFCSEVQATPVNSSSRDDCPSKDPQSRQRSGKLNRAWITFCSFALCFVLLELIARIMVGLGHPPNGPTEEFDLKYKLARKVTHAPRSACLIFLGVSFSNGAIYSELMARRLAERGLNVRVENLATAHSSGFEQLCLLKTAVKAGHKPALVVLDLRPLSFNKAFIQSGYLYERDCFLKSYAGQCFISKSTSIESRLNCFLERYCYLLRYRTYLKNVILSLKDIVFAPETVQSHYLDQIAGLGCSPGGWRPSYMIVPDDYLATHSQSYSETFDLMKNVHQWNKFSWCFDAIQPVQDYCLQEHIPLLFIFMPMHPRLEALFGAFHLSQNEFSRVFSTIPKGQQEWFLDLHDSDSDSDHFVDKTHLNAIGAITVTNKLSKILSSEPYVNCLRDSH